MDLRLPEGSCLSEALRDERVTDRRRLGDWEKKTKGLGSTRDSDKTARGM